MRSKKEFTPEQKLRRAEYARNWRKENPEKASEHARRSRIKNREKHNARQKVWREKNSYEHRKNGREWYLNNKERVKDLALQREFGITLEEYHNIMEKQNHRCAICGEPPEVDQRLFSVDHDHETGKVRGLLCRGCNVGIGNLKDDPEILMKAILYIKSFKEQN